MANDKPSDLVEEALNQALSMMKDHEEGDILVEWALVAYVTNADSDKLSAYPMLYSNGDIPVHRARGLFLTGLEKIGEFALRLDRDDDD